MEEPTSQENTDAEDAVFDSDSQAATQQEEEGPGASSSEVLDDEGTSAEEVMAVMEDVDFEQVG